MKLAPVEPLLLTRRGCPLAFDLVDADNPSGGIIGRATYLTSDFKRGLIVYDVQVPIGDRVMRGRLTVRNLLWVTSV